jgi:starvation-inducible DNA-binding protein
MKTLEPNAQVLSTRNSLPERVRHAAVSLLNERLADSIDLMMQAKQAHWNVRGQGFFSLHELFDKVYEEMSGYVDVIAERASLLGGRVGGTVRIAAERSQLNEYPLTIVDGAKHVEALSMALATFGELTRKAITEADGLGDAATADVFTEVTRGTDKLLWFVEAHGQR